jgi:histidine triad (HIT) family protein
MADCVFCSIIKREIECSLVFEDDRSIAFLPRIPVHPGHTLLMPRAHYEDVFHTPPDETINLLVVAQSIADAIQTAVKPIRVGLVAMGLDVQHTHFHLVPLYSRFDITSKAELEGSLISPSRAELDGQAELIRKNLRGGFSPDKALNLKTCTTGPSWPLSPDPRRE